MKKLIVISSDLYIRNFIQTGAFSEIECKDTYYVASDIVKNVSELKNKKNYLGSIKEKKWRITAYVYFLFPFLTFSYASKSSSFKFRSERLRHSNISVPYKMIQNIAFITSQVGGETIFPLLIKILGYDKKLYKVIKDIKPDIVIVPSSATDSLGNDATTICKKLNIPVMHLINGWDNLSSKIVYPVNPDYLCVWGPQSKEFAQNIHKIPSKSIFESGVPTFDSYFHIKKIQLNGNALKSHYPFEYALFAGCAVPFDELSALQILEETIEKTGIKNFKIIYRPHPWRQSRACSDTFEPDKFKHVMLDNQMKGMQLDTTSNFMPDLAYYPALLHNARFVICPLSTMTLEAAIFERLVLVIAYDDKIHITSPHNLLKYDHFNGIENLDGINFCKNKEDLGNVFLSLYYEATNHEKKKNRKILEQLKYYIYYDNDTYAKRLKKILDNVEKSIPSRKSF